VAVGIAAIIVALDGSDASWDALWWGYREAKRLCGRVIAVFVSPGVDAKAGMVSAVGFDLGESALAASQRTLSGLRDCRPRLNAEPRATGTLTSSSIHACSDPARELLRIAEAVNAAAIAVGKSAKVRHRVAGSLGRRLLANCRAPIIVVVP
jgi:nucleotide-binding universal stress UspA family protein